MIRVTEQDGYKQHISEQFNSELEGVKSRLLEMGGLVEEAILGAAESLEKNDLEMAERIRAQDAAIDALEEQINEECARTIALRQPTAGDLRTILTVMKISSNLERIADLSTNIAEFFG